MFGVLSILYLSVFAFFGDRANFVSSGDSDLCDVALKSMEKQTQTVPNSECACVIPPSPSDGVAVQPAGCEPVTDGIYLSEKQQWGVKEGWRQEGKKLVGAGDGISVIFESQCI